MPYCDVGTLPSSPVADSQLNNDIKIFYRTYGGGPTKVLLIIGLAATHDAWGPQIKALTGTTVPNDDDDVVWNGEEGNGGIHVCAFDNRGVGRSSVPVEKSEYSTKIMAKDAIALLDHLGWKKAHIFGHSMGAMIANKVAAMFPDRVVSLALLNVTGGGFQCFPKLDRQTFSVAYRFVKAKTPEQRAAVDLDTHYSQEYLEEYVGTDKRRAILYQSHFLGLAGVWSMVNTRMESRLDVVEMMLQEFLQDKAHQENQTHECFKRLEDMIRGLTGVVETWSCSPTKGEPPSVSHIGHGSRWEQETSLNLSSSKWRNWTF
ncbi:putative aminoacrylate hydrolase RutD [Vigna umbellata]|uniref:putative aminoacrylate hydrolase RutD n=1 Tax=Vigna umbellata TaxID=87088 RepID=UPI001F5EE5AC|nr:putative aminoacrylate hydrolase RutD [Vigna umbellata]